ncbi:hypothetical protein CROQUDRAFT_42315, partial [Cronartium quercuum f. sp. fusiforme G11]
MTFRGCSNSLKSVGIIELPLVFSHRLGSVRIKPEFVIMENATSDYCILGGEYLRLYGIDIVHKNISNDRDEEFEKAFNQCNISPRLKSSEASSLRKVVKMYKKAFAYGENPIGTIKGHEVVIRLNIEKPYPPILKKQAYPASPRSREEIERHIEELLKFQIIRKVGPDEEVDVTTPIIIAWHNGKSCMCGDFRALNTFTVPDRYPMPRITHCLTNLGSAMYIT